MNQKGLTPIYLLIILALLGTFLFVRFISPAKPNLIAPQVTNSSTQIPPKDAPSEQIDQARLEKYLTVEAALLAVSDNISLSFKDLDHGKEVNIEPTRQWIPASTIKAFVILEAFRQRDLGLIDFDKEVTIAADNVVPTELETDEFPRLREGTKITIYQLVEAMIIQSDNTAYNTLLDILDRRNINLALKNIGITETIVGEKLNLDETQFQQDLQIPGRQSNTTTAKDLTTFFDHLFNKKIAHAEEILSIFKRQKLNNMIPAFLPQNTVVAHKTGDWAPIYHDAGVIFKPGDPFVLSILTNKGDPSVVAQIAKVAYFQTADSIGQGIDQNSKTTSMQSDHPKSSNQLISLEKLPDGAAVLAEETPEKFPTISASDLGITSRDLNPNTKQISDLRQALIVPGSILYGIKQFFEQEQLVNARSPSALVTAHLNLAKSRLAEVKRLLGSGDLKEADKLLLESENHLVQATDLAKTDPNRELLLLKIKNINDLHFAILSDKGKSIPPSSKEQFVDSVYNFYQNNQKNVAPVIKSSVIANPIQQKPAIGSISEIKGGEATLKFDDGTTKQIILTDDTQVRPFQSDNYQNIDSIKPGDKVAVLGLTNKESKIIPQFILKDIPKELPNKHTGTVIEIKPDENTLKILNKAGQVELINILNNTTIKSKDTNVSLEGIKAGSQVTIFGTTEKNTTSSPTTTGSPSTIVSPTPDNGSPVPVNLTHPSGLPNPTSQPPQKTVSSPSPTTSNQTPTQPTSKSPTIEIKATSITITKNSSGAQEKVTPKKEEPKKQEPQKPVPPKLPPPPAAASISKPDQSKPETKPSK